MAMTPAERFWAKVDASGDCWLWLGSTNNGGYGQLTRGKRDKWLAHRYALTICGVLLNEHDVVCHHCDNPGCVRPSHLFVGSMSDNIRDAVTKGRMNTHRKLTSEQVAEIRRRYRRVSKEETKKTRKLDNTQAALAREFGVGVSTVAHIINGATWKTA